MPEGETLPLMSGIDTERRHGQHAHGDQHFNERDREGKYSTMPPNLAPSGTAEPNSNAGWGKCADRLQEERILHCGQIGEDNQDEIIRTEKNQTQTLTQSTTNSEAEQIRASFLRIAALFAINHGTVVSCLGLASARLGNTIGSLSSSVLYGCYTGFALTGATFVVKRTGARVSLILAMGLLGVYVTSFWAVLELCHIGDHGAAGGHLADDDDGVNSHDGDGIDSLSGIPSNDSCPEIVALVGATLGGIGSSVLWISQGTLFSLTSIHYARATGRPVTSITNRFGGEWAFVFLAIELFMRALSTLLVDWLQMEWTNIFGLYALLALGPVIAMRNVTTVNEDCEYQFVTNERDDFGLGTGFDNESVIARTKSEINENERINPEVSSTYSLPEATDRNTSHQYQPEKSTFCKALAAIDLLLHDAKMKYVSIFNITFGLCSSFGISVISGQVIRVALHDENSTYVGIYNAVISSVAAVASLLFGRIEDETTRSPSFCSSRAALLNSSSMKMRLTSSLSYIVDKIPWPKFDKGAVLTLGALSYLLVALMFLLFPSFSTWNGYSLLLIYFLLGVGRSTYEGTLRAVYADFFPMEKEGAFANIILFNGVASTMGYSLNAATSHCDESSPYCLYYNDGSVHYVLVMEVMIIVSAVLAIWGYQRAKALHLAQNANSR